MELNCFQITDACGLQPEKIEAVPPGLAREGTSFWIDLEGSDFAQLSDLLKPYNLPPWVVERCLESGRTAGVAAFEHGVFFEFPARHDLDERDVGYVSFVCTPQLLISIHRGPMAPLSDAVCELQKGARLPAASIGALLYWLLDHFFDAAIPIGLLLRDRSERVSEAFDEQPDTVDTGDIHNLKRKVRRLEVTLEDQHFCVLMLKRTQWGAFLVDSHQALFANMDRGYQQGLREIRRLASRLQELHQQYQVRQQDLMNKRLKVLAIVQSVFVPLTLIAGLYGMNFKFMPELEWPHAYPTLLGIMLLIAIVILWLFHRKGWFD